MDNHYHEFTHGPWRMRAVLCPNVPVYEIEAYTEGQRVDMFIWFVAHDDDCWFAHGVTDYIDEEAAEQIGESIPGEEMDIMISYAGDSWDVCVADDPVIMGNLHRAAWNGMQTGLLDDLKKMSRSEIRALRMAEEAGFSNN